VDSKEAGPEFDSLEAVPGFEHEQLQEKVWETATPDELREGLEKAFDCRGEVTLTLKDGGSIEGYIFDRRPGCDAGGFLDSPAAQRAWSEADRALLRNRRPRVYRPRSAPGKEMGSLGEEVLGEEARGREEY